MVHGVEGVGAFPPAAPTCPGCPPHLIVLAALPRHDGVVADDEVGIRVPDVDCIGVGTVGDGVGG